MGLFASSYLNYYTISKEKKHLDKAQECIDWLISNKIEKGEGIGWGYPFSWQSTQYIERALDYLNQVSRCCETRRTDPQIPGSGQQEDLSSGPTPRSLLAERLL